MIRPVHPAFETFGNREAAEACSELVFRMPDFKRWAADPTVTNEYPPVPSMLTSIAIAYSDDGGTIRRKYTMFPQKEVPLDPERDADTFLDSYRQTVAEGQSVAMKLRETLPPAMTESTLQELADVAAENSQRDKLRTIGMFTVFTAVAPPHKKYGAFLIPRRTQTEVPLHFRQMFIDTKLAVGADVFAAYMGERLDGVIKEFIQNNPRDALLAFMAVSLYMPTLEEMTYAVNEQVEYQQTVGNSKANKPTPGTNRLAANLKHRLAAERTRRQGKRKQRPH